MATLVPAPTAFSVIPDFGSYPGVVGYDMTITGATTFTLSPGYARALCSDFALSFPSFQPNTPSLLTVDISTVGALGCYPNSIASLALQHNTVFGVYVIGKSSGTTGGSLNSLADAVSVVVATGNNFLPPNVGYDSYRRVGYVIVNHSTSHLVPFQQNSLGNAKQYILQDPFVALSAGSAVAGAPGVLDLTASDGPIVPNKNITVLLNVEITPNAADGYVCVEPGTLTATSVAPVEIFGSVAGHMNSSYVQMTATPNASTGNANIQYFVDNASSTSTINVVGFIDNLSLSLA